MDHVILRRWRTGHKDVLALMPYIPAGLPWQPLVTSYQHVGQHGAADYHHVIRQTVPVDESEPDAIELLAELRSLGYMPLTIRRVNHARMLKAQREQDYPA
jgi:hypothetical protein